MSDEETFSAQRFLQEFDAQDGRLDLLAVTVPAGENRKIRDEIRTLAGNLRVDFLNIEADTIRAQITGASEELIRKFEDAGWGWE
jgi:hypothetical protein